MPTQQQQAIKVEIRTARPFVSLGGVLVALVEFSNGDPHDKLSLDAIEVSLVARCRLDSRWHPSKVHSSKDPWKDMPVDKSFSIWYSPPVDLKSLEENNPAHQPTPKPVLLQRCDGKEAIGDTEAVSKGSKDDSLAYTVRIQVGAADLHLPPTLSATSCRYYYQLVVRYESKHNHGPQFKSVPIHVVSPNPRFQNIDGITSFATAHTGALPCSLHSSDFGDRLSDKLTVHQTYNAAHTRHIAGASSDAVQTMRVTDPVSGNPVCLLTIIGAHQAYPGSRVVIKLDFPRSDTAANWVPVHQVSSCLEGEETVRRSSEAKRTRARVYLLDTAHVGPLDPNCVESTSMQLLFPQSTPVSVSTNFVCIQHRCAIDIAVRDSGGKSKTGFRNLRLEVPCNVFDAPSAFEIGDETDQHDTQTDWPGFREESTRIANDVSILSKLIVSSAMT